VKFKPTAADLLTCEQSGRDLATAVKKRLKNKELAAAGGPCSPAPLLACSPARLLACLPA
jgi:hypothetical protein